MYICISATSDSATTANMTISEQRSCLRSMLQISGVTPKTYEDVLKVRHSDAISDPNENMHCRSAASQSSADSVISCGSKMMLPLDSRFRKLLKMVAMLGSLKHSPHCFSATNYQHIRDKYDRLNVGWKTEKESLC